jgi:hypothetical protein
LFQFMRARFIFYIQNGDLHLIFNIVLLIPYTYIQYYKIKYSRIPEIQNSEFRNILECNARRVSSTVAVFL